MNVRKYVEESCCLSRSATIIRNHVDADHGIFATEFIFTNGIKTNETVDVCERLLIVLKGECDILLQGRPVRLSRGSWVNIPRHTPAAIHIYRSPEECHLIEVLTIARGTGKAVCGCIYDLPLCNGNALWGFESGLCAQLLVKDSATRSDGLSIPVEGTKDLLFFSAAPQYLAQAQEYILWLKQAYGILWGAGTMLP